jgi:hypothetical protein
VTEIQRPEDVIENSGIQGPKIVHEGRYRLYENPDGGLRIQYRRDGKDEDDFVQLPGPIVALGKAAAEGNMSPLELMRRMMSLMGEMRK